MKTAKPLVGKVTSMLTLSATILLSSGQAHAQWAVFDASSLRESIIHELNQLEQIALGNAYSLQQLKDYRLQLQNLQQLPGTIRSQVQTRLEHQLLNNIKDFGKSVMNKQATQNPNSASYYTNAEDITAMTIGNVPRPSASTAAEMSSLGMQTDNSQFVRSSQKDRIHYERVADDLRQVALTRQNSEDRAVQANSIANQMTNLSDNNTVGAIQLLSAQNSLAYAQQEDIAKNQAAILKNQQEQQLRELAEREAGRAQELERLRKVREAPRRTNVNMTPGSL